MKRVLFFLTIIFIFNSCLGNFNHSIKKNIIDKYYIIASDSKSQATISVFNKKYDSYISVTPEGIVAYTVIDKKYIISRDKNKNYYLIRIGSETSKKYSLKKINEFLKIKKTNISAIKWEDI